MVPFQHTDTSGGHLEWIDTSGGNTYSGTTTTLWLPENLYSRYFMPVVEPLAVPVSPLERHRTALLRVRRARRSLALSRPSAALTGLRAAAPRRTVVARGHVSWVRAGTRRPL